MLNGYTRYDNGVIKDESPISVNYNIEYSDKYNSYGIKTTQISHLRFGYLTGCIGRFPQSILDVGYGNGDFLNLCSSMGIKSFGNDISGYQLKSDIINIDNITENNFDVISFFDSLEHFDNIDFVSELKCNYVIISLPWCHYFSDDWFETWKHRRRGEHIWHFDDKALIRFMEDKGYSLLKISNIEDTVRTTEFNYNNILTGVFKKII